MNRQEVVRLVTLAFTNFPNMQEKDATPTVLLWERILFNIPYEIGEKALLQVLMGNRFFPTVADLMESIKNVALKDNRLPSPEEAWAEVKSKLDSWKTPEWSNKVIKKAVQAMGYLELCQSENQPADRAHFMRIYESFKTREEEKIIDNQIESIMGNQKLLKEVNNA